jgi:hypothetical protein
MTPKVGGFRAVFIETSDKPCLVTVSGNDNMIAEDVIGIK